MCFICRIAIFWATQKKVKGHSALQAKALEKKKNLHRHLVFDGEITKRHMQQKQTRTR